MSVLYAKDIKESILKSSGVNIAEVKDTKMYRISHNGGTIYFYKNLLDFLYFVKVSKVNGRVTTVHSLLTPNGEIVTDHTYGHFKNKGTAYSYLNKITEEF